ncbi:MAG TPA: acyltransferase [Pseudomonadales bacterium]|nr:acyltransferase [Pseudomonadales bacterium]
MNKTNEHKITSMLALIAFVAYWQLSTSIPIWLFVLWCFFQNTPVALPTSIKKIKPKTLAALSQSRNNNFNLLRLLAAWSILFFHSYVLTGTMPTSWFDTHIGRYMGFYAVNVFFFISGFLVTQSIERSSLSRRYLTLRFMRLVPPLCMAMLSSILLLGPLMTTLPVYNYFCDLADWFYLAISTSMKDMHFTLPGVFANNHYPNIVNGSLWTLVQEIRLYIFLFLLAQLGVIRNRYLLLATTAGIFALYFIRFFQIEATVELAELWREKAHNILLVHLYFFLGFLAAQLAHWLPIHWRYSPLLALPVLCLQHTFLHDLSIAVLVAYLVLLLTYGSGNYLHFYNKLGDYSYGTYLYAFPIQQMLVAWFPGLSFTELVLYATPTALCCALASWHLLENPLMTYSKNLHFSKATIGNNRQRVLLTGENA